VGFFADKKISATHILGEKSYLEFDGFSEVPWLVFGAFDNFFDRGVEGIPADF